MVGEQTLIDFEARTTANHQVREFENSLRRLPVCESVECVGAEYQRQTVTVKREISARAHTLQTVDRIRRLVSLQFDSVQRNGRVVGDGQFDQRTALLRARMRFSAMHRQSAGHELQRLQPQPGYDLVGDVQVPKVNRVEGSAQYPG